MNDIRILKANILLDVQNGYLMDFNQNIPFLLNSLIFWKVAHGTKFEYEELWKRRCIYGGRNFNSGNYLFTTDTK